MIDEANQTGNEDEGTLFRDAIFLALFGFVLIAFILLLHFNPVAKEMAADPPGNVIVEITWPVEMDVDVDLWVKGPGTKPVGYSNKGGELFNLLRDDLGHKRDHSGINHEIVYSRGIRKGEYIVNLHLYSNYTRQWPVPVNVRVSRKVDSASNIEYILERQVDLVSWSQELTVFRFRLTEQGELLKDSVNAIATPLRSLNVGQNS